MKPDFLQLLQLARKGKTSTAALVCATCAGFLMGCATTSQTVKISAEDCAALEIELEAEGVEVIGPNGVPISYPGTY